MTRIAHLIDDLTPGGVTRLIDHIQSDRALAALGEHLVVPVTRGGFAVSRIDADVIVSHIGLNWQRLPWLLQLRALHAATPMIHVEHSYTAAFARHNVARPKRFHTMLRVAYSLFERVVSVSEAQGKWLVEQGLVDSSLIEVIPSVVDVTPFLDLRPATNDIRIIGAFGRLEPQKGFDRLILAMRACRRGDLVLEIHGGGSERARLETLAGGDPRIRFMGHATDPATAMSLVDAVAMPSRWEAYGLVALEARAAGRTLLVSPADGLNDHVARGAIMVRDAATRGWSEALEALGTPDAARLARARQDAALAPTRFAHAWAQLLSEVMAKPEEMQAA